MYKVAFSIGLVALSVIWWKSIDVHPTIGNISDFLKSYEYIVETHQVQTEDGYILTMHRIPEGRNEVPKNTKKPAVFLMHGLLLSSIDWVIKGPEKAVGLILADAGYDVWIGNYRGNTCSRKHLNLDPIRDKEAFYNSSYHEIGIYDIPAMVDYVLEHTGQAKLSYIGFSQGVTSFLVMGALRPEYNEKILIMNAWAPVTNMHATSSFIFNTLRKFPYVLKVIELLKWYEMFDITTAPAFRFICRSSSFICDGLFGLLGSSDEQMPDKNFQLAALSNFPSGMSLKQLSHYVQGSISGIFAPYNRNFSNVKKSDSYDLAKVTAPMIFYYGEEDNLVNHVLLNEVIKDIPNVKKIYRVPYRGFNHLDFLWGKDVQLLNEETLKNINYFNENFY
ncbi:lipase 1-like isoform X2 [Euwallacea similis]|uniref:lipase 1-like isoform X2 n=1 Tax=Euwallacea similis TaxID=1736056 RepID=UPI00344DBBBE